MYVKVTCLVYEYTLRNALLPFCPVLLPCVYRQPCASSGLAYV